MKHIYTIFDFSNLLNVRTGIISFSTGIIGSALTKIYGGEIFLLSMLALLLVIAFDWGGAIGASKKDGTYASEYGIQGVIRSAVLLALPAWGIIMDRIFGLPNVIFFLLWGGIMFHTITSMTANFKRAGWDRWIPNWALEFVASEIEAKIRRAESRMHIGEKEKKQ